MIESPVNRIKDHFTDAKPATRQERGDNYIDTLQFALDSLRGLMTSFNPDMQFKAAMAVLDFEKTRLRHDRKLAGMELTPPIDLDEPMYPIPKKDKEIMDDMIDDLDEDLNDEPKLTDEQEEKFEKMVDETVEYFNNENDTLGKPHVSWDLVETKLWAKLCEIGFETMAANFRSVMDKLKVKAPTPKSSSGLLDWPG